MITNSAGSKAEREGDQAAVLVLELARGLGLGLDQPHAISPVRPSFEDERLLRLAVLQRLAQ
jgi:hypothetical protein